MNGYEQDYMPETQPDNDVGEPGGDEVAKLKAEVADLKDRLVRALADAENTRVLRPLAALNVTPR